MQTPSLEQLLPLLVAAVALAALLMWPPASLQQAPSATSKPAVKPAALIALPLLAGALALSWQLNRGGF